MLFRLRKPMYIVGEEVTIEAETLDEAKSKLLAGDIPPVQEFRVPVFQTDLYVDELPVNSILMEGNLSVN